jgi:CRP-like cAMP-binding protein
MLGETVLGLSLGTLLATSGIAIAVLGFALRDTLAGVVGGIALSLERPYQIGDWIEPAAGQGGRVVEVGWLTTRLVNNEQVVIVVPNARLATATFRNYGAPGGLVREQIAVPLDHGLPPARIERILLAAARSVPEIAAAGRAPDIKIQDLAPDAVRWLVRFWLIDYARLPEIRYALHRAILRHLHQAGLALTYPKLDLFHSPMPPRVLSYEADLDRLLERSELFSMLPREDLATLAGRARKLRFASGTTIVRQGEPGASLFVVMEGIVAIAAAAPGGERAIDTLGPGAMFGELALLTGAPRSATVRAQAETVLFEIGREDLVPVLQRRPELAQALGRVLAERQDALGRRLAADPAATLSPDERERVLLDRIRAFFGV